MTGTLSDLIDLGGEREIVVCQPAAVVGRYFEFGKSPPEVDVRMMICGFCQFPNLVHKTKAGGKISKLEPLRQLDTLCPPSGQCA